MINTIFHLKNSWCLHVILWLLWHLQIKDEIADLTKDIHKMKIQIRNCDSKLHQATHRLDILNQRPRFELCLDQVCALLNICSKDMKWLQTETQKAWNGLSVLSCCHCWCVGFSPVFLFLLFQPHISLTLEKRDLAKVAAGLHPILKRSQ